MCSSSTPSHLVILRDVGDPRGCPGDIRTFKCSLQNDALEWYCTDDVHRTIVCGANNIMNITCYNQTLTSKDHDCYSNGTITSLVEINVSFPGTNWTCMNPRNISQNTSVTVTVGSKFPQ